VFLIVCIFVFLQFIKVIYTAVTAIKMGLPTEQEALLLCVAGLAGIYELRITVL
jgi:hypothetical protein